MGKCRDIPITHLTVKSLTDAFEKEKGSRRKNETKKQTPCVPKTTPTKRMTAIDILRNVLQEGCRRRKKRGWRRLELNMNEKIKTVKKAATIQ